LESCSNKNTLVALPTGMGKTKTAILVAINRLNTHKGSNILFLTPTKPLANQIYEEFKECTNIEDIFLFTGAIAPQKREEISKKAKIVISTPQTIENDVINNTFNFKNTSLLVIDEAHRAVQNYSYTWLAKRYIRESKDARIIGLTASPGSDLEKIKEVCKNLYIKEIEVRTEKDPDVKKYIQEVDTEWIKVNLPENFKEIKLFLENAYTQRLEELKKFGYIRTTTKLSKKELLKVMSSLQGEIARGQRDFEVFKSISCSAEAIKIGHAIELIETQGAESLYTYLKSIFDGTGKNKTKSAKNLTKDLNIKSAFILSKKMCDSKIEHPKEIELKNIIKKELKDNPETRIIIFNQYRDSAKKIEGELKKIDGINPKLFVGQLKKKGTGLTQKEQVQIIKDFEDSIYNCLISTSIGEEGLDIPKVELVIFYEPVPSAIRSIQRRGRTARLEKGKVKVLITKNTRDEVYHWASVHKEKRMYAALKELRGNLNLTEQQKLEPYTKKEDIKIYADSREQGSSILKELSELGLDLTVKSLKSADFIVSNRVGIERKTSEDFVNSIIDKRLLLQLKDLKENFERPILIIEGNEDIYSIRNIHPNAIRGMLATIAVSYRIPIIHTQNFKETAELIRTIAKREQQTSNTSFGTRIEKKPVMTKEQQEFIIESLPGIGPTLAKSILKKFKTVKKIINSSKEELESVEKLGPKKAKNIREILDEIYEN